VKGWKIRRVYRRRMIGVSAEVKEGNEIKTTGTSQISKMTSFWFSIPENGVKKKKKKKKRVKNTNALSGK
jgi:hypothetical protein